MEKLILAATITFTERFLEALGTSPGEIPVDKETLEKILRSLDPLVQKSLMLTYGLVEPGLILLPELKKEAQEKGQTIWDSRERGLIQIRKKLALPDMPEKKKRRLGRKPKEYLETTPPDTTGQAQECVGCLLDEGLLQLLDEVRELIGKTNLLIEKLLAEREKITEKFPAAEDDAAQAPLEDGPAEKKIAYPGRSDAARLLRSPAFREDLGVDTTFEKLREVLRSPDLEKFRREVLVTTYCTKDHERFSPSRIADSRGGSPKTIRGWVDQALDFIRRNNA